MQKRLDMASTWIWLSREVGRPARSDSVWEAGRCARLGSFGLSIVKIDFLDLSIIRASCVCLCTGQLVEWLIGWFFLYCTLYYIWRESTYRPRNWFSVSKLLEICVWTPLTLRSNDVPVCTMDFVSTCLCWLDYKSSASTWTQKINMDYYSNSTSLAIFPCCFYFFSQSRERD